MIINDVDPSTSVLLILTVGLSIIGTLITSILIEIITNKSKKERKLK